ncbi:aldose 1-epimerase family protein [Pacificibacter marinus]|uniref:aldose 1-epimerase family protein n=1 Tax=Pacificibacter marinus TaxID=658057 RepID=UPI001C06A974|nr:aldose 1-epimerase family protein [Pacificibacter marinus]MBU2868288.1 aldose 1-epimerase family protein [Pacificibacter marinus]
MSSLCQLRNDALTVAVAPLGAEMQYLRTSAGDDLLWSGDAAYWTGRAPVLFPIVGRAPEDMIAVGDHRAPMKQHGFARRSVFEVVEQTETMCRHLLTQSDESRAVYPFDFDLEIRHEIKGATLHVSATVRNTGVSPMPFGFGFHPAFRFPLPHAGSDAHHVTLADKSSPDMRKIDDGLLRAQVIESPFTQGDLELHDEMFAEDALVFPNGARALRYGPATPSGKGISLDFEFTNLPDLALWRPLGAPFLCIEPWHGTAPYIGDSHQIAERPNSTTLAAGGEARFGYAVTVSA